VVLIRPGDAAAPADDAHTGVGLGTSSAACSKTGVVGIERAIVVAVVVAAAIDTAPNARRGVRTVMLILRWVAIDCGDDDGGDVLNGPARMPAVNHVPPACDRFCQSVARAETSG